MKGKIFWIVLLSWMAIIPVLEHPGRAAEPAPGGWPTEQEIATERFFASLESVLAEKFFDPYRRPRVRVAILDFTDGAGNVVKSGKELADKITRRLYRQPQFDVVSQQKIQRYMSWVGVSALGRLDAAGLYRLQRRINTLDPGNGIHALILGEVQKGVSRNLHVRIFLVNFQFPIGAIEREKNLVGAWSLSAEIPMPTEQALQEAAEIVMAGRIQPLEEGRLLILANTRGNGLEETEYVRQLGKDRPFVWEKIPALLLAGTQEGSRPEQVTIGLGRLPLAPLAAPDAVKRLEYSFLHGKCATNEIYFDERIPAQAYPLMASSLDLKTNETFSEMTEVQVFPGTTTVAILSIHIPGEKERLRVRQPPRIQVFQLFGKGLDIVQP